MYITSGNLDDRSLEKQMLKDISFKLIGDQVLYMHAKKLFAELFEQNITLITKSEKYEELSNGYK